MEYYVKKLFRMENNIWINNIIINISIINCYKFIMSMKRFGNVIFFIVKILVYVRYRFLIFVLKVIVKLYLIKDILCNMCIY